jgi:carbamoyltransferase
MLILGLNHGELSSSAALYKDGKIIAGASEERFNREKKTKKFPGCAIKFCLEYARIDLADVDFIAQAWNPGAAWHKFNPLLSGQRTKREDYFYTIPDNLFHLSKQKIPGWVFMDFSRESSMPRIYYIQHHQTHAANAFFLSPFEKAAIMTADLRGEFECLSLGTGAGNQIKPLTTQQIPDSLGMFYAACTELLGYRPDNDEWKVMALSAFDIDCRKYYDAIRQTVSLEDDGKIRLDQSCYKGALIDQPKLYTEKLMKLLGGREGLPQTGPDEWHMGIAKAMQKVSEEMATHILKYLYKKTESNNLVVGGGFFMNSVYNGKILEQTPFENLYISHSPADLGNSIGAALYVAHCIKEQPRSYQFNSSYLGPGFNGPQIESACQRRAVTYQKLENPAETIAKLLAQGEIVAHFHGRMEFGERALGNRSILANPKLPEMKDKINSMIKYRESYRPFAPAALFEKAHEYFEIPVGYECHFMEKVVMIRPEYRGQLPAVTHVDGSGRLQTVAKEQNQRFFEIIEEFEKISGLPIVLNTSFNINGEPITLSPDDALNTFFNSGLRYLVMENFLVSKAAKN